MIVSWWDDFACYVPTDEGIEVSEELWHNYSTILRVKVELEDQIRAEDAQLDADLENLRGVLSDEELQALHARRRAVDAAVAPREGQQGALPQVVQEEPTPAPVVPIGGGCAKSPNGTGPHVALRYVRDGSNGQLIGICKCGRQMQNPDCPHQVQVKRGRNIACADCGKTIIHNTGFSDNDTGTDRYVPPPPMRPTAAAPAVKGFDGPYVKPVEPKGD